MGKGSRALELLIALFLVVHIPITIFIDAQALFPQEWFHPALLQASNDYLAQYGDPLMTPPHAPWFLSMVWGEVLVQLPFFVIGAYAFLARRNWIRVPAVAYSSWVLSTMVPILYELWVHSAPGYNRTAVLAFYTPWALFPALIFAKTAFREPFARDAPRDPWGDAHKHKWI